MAKQLKDIQEIINKAADDRLIANINTLNTFLWSGENRNLLEGIQINTGTAEKPNMSQAYYIFSDLKERIISNNTERYRAEEAKKFMDKVNSIRQDVDNLMGVQSDVDDLPY